VGGSQIIPKKSQLGKYHNEFVKYADSNLCTLNSERSKISHLGTFKGVEVHNEIHYVPLGKVQICATEAIFCCPTENRRHLEA
jgi:hypothetical protein